MIMHHLFKDTMQCSRPVYDSVATCVDRKHVEYYDELQQPEWKLSRAEGSTAEARKWDKVENEVLEAIETLRLTISYIFVEPSFQDSRNLGRKSAARGEVPWPVGSP